MDHSGRSAYWDDVATLVEQSRGRCKEYDPETGEPRTPIAEGVVPIVELSARARRDDVTLSQVERSLLEGVLNDWLRAYARVHGATYPGGFSVHDVVLASRNSGSIRTAVYDLVVDGSRPSEPL